MYQLHIHCDHFISLNKLFLRKSRLWSVWFAIALSGFLRLWENLEKNFLLWENLENSEEIFYLASEEKFLGDTFCVFAHNNIFTHIFNSSAFLLHLTYGLIATILFDSIQTLAGSEIRKNYWFVKNRAPYAIFFWNHDSFFLPEIMILSTFKNSIKSHVQLANQWRTMQRSN